MNAKRCLDYVLAIAVVVSFCSVTFAIPPIPKPNEGGTMTATADATDPAFQGNSPAGAIDGIGETDGGSGFWCGDFDWTEAVARAPHWLRVDLQAPYLVQRVDVQGEKNDHSMDQVSIYVTDVDSTNRADWGEPTATGSIPFTGARTTFNMVGYGRYVYIYGTGHRYGTWIRELWLYGDSERIMLPDPIAVRMYTSTSRDVLYTVKSPPDPAALIKADIALSDASGAIASLVINGNNVTSGADDVMSFDGDPDWACNEGPLAISSSGTAGTAQVLVTESDTDGYTPQNAMAPALNVEVVDRVVKMDGSLVIVLPFEGTASRSVKIVDATLASPGATSVTLGTANGSSATIAANGDIFIAGDAFTSDGTIDITASSATSGVTTCTITMGNDFKFQETGTNTVTLKVVVLPEPFVYVSGTGSDTTGEGSQAKPFRTIGFGVSVALGEVRVLPGTYSPSEGEVLPLRPGAVRIVGVGDPADKVIDGEDSVANLFEFKDTVVGNEGWLANLTLTGSTQSAINADNGLFSLDGCVFTTITPTNAPGGIRLVINSKVTATNCRFESINGRGAVGIEADNNFVCEFRATGCTFSGNTSSIGTVYNLKPPHDRPLGKIWLTSCDFENNNALNTAPVWWYMLPSTGVHMVQNPNQTNLNIDRCKFIGGNGGNVLGLVNCNGVVKNSLFANNEPATDLACMFGGYTYALTFTNCTTIGNSNDGGLAVTLTGRAAAATTFANCIIADNLKLNAYEELVAKLILKSTILWNTPPGEGYNEAASANVLEVDPLLTENSHLRSRSPAIDAGDNTLVSGYLTGEDAFDLDGLSRIVDGNGDLEMQVPPEGGDPIEMLESVDMGCYELQKPELPGDANGDCKVNILDLIFIRNRLNQDVATGDNWKADVNTDEKINILDLIFTRNHLNTTCPE